MSLERGLPWHHGNLNFKGYSLAGITTSIVFENAKICFDIGPGVPFSQNAGIYCLSHCHADHAGGINFLLSQRSLFSLPHTNILLPEVHVEPINNILQQWQNIEGFQYNYTLIPAKPNQPFGYGKYKIVPFQTTHRIDSVGYIVYEKRKKLKEEFASLSREEIIEKRKKKVDVQEELLEPLVAFTGDTQIEFLQSHPDIFKAKVLLMECTYIDDRRTIEKTRQWGHIHLDELLPYLDLFHNEKVCFIHLSARYKSPEAQRILQDKLGDRYKAPFELFPRPF